ncbi:MAG: arginyltransferase [Gammaproteobacteria bacterium SHHR-1]|uniref:arginyltransferase n=1 Tax=Magnetovirga frankeli TaxID=947516 RepID=UPI00129408D9|nr:arginyltransferase [gamma proteobacterium SS-5]
MRPHLPLLQTPSHGCSYLAERQAITQFIEPGVALHDRLYQALLEQGFRRSGGYVYRPQCPDCAACIPLRIPVRHWRPRRNQRRAWNRVAAELEIHPLPARFDPNQFQLYRRYIEARHGDGDMADPSAEDYMRFLTSDWCTTRFVELRWHQRLLAVAVTDYLPGGLSAVYSFYEPELAHLSPGVIGLLWQIQETSRLGLPYLYLGYWIEQSPKMAYKIQYRPNQGYIQGEWRDLP